MAAQAVTVRVFLTAPSSPVLLLYRAPPYFFCAVCRAVKKGRTSLRHLILYFNLCVQGHAGEARRLTLAAGQFGGTKRLYQSTILGAGKARSALVPGRPQLQLQLQLHSQLQSSPVTADLSSTSHLTFLRRLGHSTTHFPQPCLRKCRERTLGADIALPSFVHLVVLTAHWARATPPTPRLLCSALLALARRSEVLGSLSALTGGPSLDSSAHKFGQGNHPRDRGRRRESIRQKSPFTTPPHSSLPTKVRRGNQSDGLCPHLLL